jgi:hypothetical protein
MKIYLLWVPAIMLVILTVMPFVAIAQTVEMKVLFLGNNTTNWEFPVVSTITDVGHFKFNYTLTQDKKLPDANPENFDILWVGQGEICENGYLFNDDGINAILAFAEGGGVVINVEQDSDDQVGCPTDWLPEDLEGAERPGTDNFVPTGDEGDLFTFPETVKIVHTNDKWHTPGPNFKVLATDGADFILIATLEHGEGMYIVTSLQNENKAQAEINVPIMTNILYRAAMHRQSNFAVDATGKLANTWGSIRAKY